MRWSVLWTWIEPGRIGEVYRSWHWEGWAPNTREAVIASAREFPDQSYGIVASYHVEPIV